MRQSFRVGRIRGVEILMHWSFFVAFFFIVLVVAKSLFFAWHPDWGRSLLWSCAALATLLYAAAVSLHELAHITMARWLNIGIERIQLFFFGGVGYVEQRTRTPWSEFLTAVVGPFVSLSLGLLFTALSGAGAWTADVADPLAWFGRMDVGQTLMAWFALANATIGLVNLIPAYPLDGGIMLRALFWELTGNHQRATRWTSALALAVGWFMIAGGIVLVFGAGFPKIGVGVVPGMTLMILGWCLLSVANKVYGRVWITRWGHRA